MPPLKPLKPKKKNYNIWFYDTESTVQTVITPDNINKVLAGETVTKEHKIYLIVAEHYQKKALPYVYSGEGVSICKSFWNDVTASTTKKNTTLVFAHNAKYDIIVSQAIPCLIEMGWGITMFSESNPFFIFFEKDGKEIRIISSTNYYSMSLAKLAKSFGLVKGEIDYSLNDTGGEIEYCKQDVKILRVAMVAFMEFLEKQKLGSLSITLAGQAFQAYLTKFYKGNIHLDHDKEAVKLERDAYYGGRCEAWQIGEIHEKLYYLDINSMYPHVMLKYRFPCKRVTQRKKIKIDELKTLLNKGYLAIAKCYINTDKPCYPKKNGGKLCFPIGQFWTTLNTPELIYAIEHNHIIEIRETNIYIGADLFSDYVTFFYNERLQAKANGDEVHTLLYKLFLNCLYGKFGQREQGYEVVGKTSNVHEIRHENIRDVKNGNRRVRVFGGNIFEKKTKEVGEDEGKKSFCAIASHVTAYARMLLWEYIETVGQENVMYMDTDSLFVTKQAYDQLKEAGCIDNKELGKLKLEEDIYFTTINGCKDYRLCYLAKDKKLSEIIRFDCYVNVDTSKLKGVTASSIQIEQDKYISAVWHGLNYWLKSGQLSNYHNTLMLKHLKREYTKGIKTESGRVKPHTINE